MVGQLFGHYRVDSQLGAGGMGVVFRAHDTRLHRDVAIKRLQDPLDQSARGRLLDEARAASALNHPNICTIYEVAETPDSAFIVMEYIDGQPLGLLIPSTGFSLETVLRYGIQVADALAHAHERGVVHRDLKASNIIVTSDQRAKVLDFGLARRLPQAEAEEVTRPVASPLTTDISGTPGYMAPEVLRGYRADARSDIWALGIVLYEMTTGHRPFSGETPFAVAARVLSDESVQLPASIPPALAAVIRRCLEKHPQMRYRQAGEVRAALEAIQHGSSPAVARPVPAPRRRRLPDRRWIAAAGAALAVGLGAAVIEWPDMRGVFGLLGEPAIAFAERDWALLADFENRTGEAGFDRALDTGLAAALSQSRHVNVVPPVRIRETLRRMGRAGQSRVDEATGVEIARREGIRLLIAPAIARAGNGYVLSAALIDPGSGAVLRAENAEAAGTHELLPALDRLSRDIRERLGEATDSLSADSKPLEQVTTSSLEALTRFSQAREAHIAQQFEKARGLYEDALRLDPAFTAARASLGIINVEFFDRAFGQELLSQAIRAVDGLTDQERMTVLAFHATFVERDFEKAAESYRTFLADHPDSAAAHNNLGRVYMQQRRWRDAIVELREAIRLEPDLMLAYFSLNHIYLYEVADLDAAIELCQRQLTRADRNPRAYGQLASAHFGKGDLRQAEVAFRRAIELDPRFPIDRYRLGHTLRLQGRLTEAREAFEEILAIDPSEHSAHYDAAVIADLLGDHAGARRHLRTVVDARTRELDAKTIGPVEQLELASALARLDEIRRADTIARAAAHAPVPVEQAAYLSVRGRTDDALRHLEQAVDGGFRNLVWLKMHPDLAVLHGDARFEEVLRKMGS